MYNTKEKSRAFFKRYNNTPERRLSRRESYHRHSVRYRAERLKKRSENRALEALKWREYRAKNPEIISAIDKRRNSKPRRRADASAASHKRRALKLGNTVNPDGIKKFTTRIRSSEIVDCYYCKKQISGKLVHFDHIVPLSKGGSHSVENLCASCPHCNFTKSNKLIQDWFRLGQQILSL